MSQREKKKLGYNEEQTTLNGKVESAELWKPASAQQWRFVASWHDSCKEIGRFGASYIYMVNYLLTAPPNIYTRCWDVGM